MKLKKFKFGFADATTEFSRNPEIFENAFYDPKNIVDKLVNDYHFLLIGRKGVGKSAICSKLRLLSNSKEYGINVFPVNLNDFDFSIFAKTAVDSDVTGTQKYKKSWDFILLLSFYRFLFNNLSITESEYLNDVIFLLDKAGFSLDGAIKEDITRLTKIKYGLKIVEFEQEFAKKYKINPDNYIEKISIVIEKMFQGIAKTALNEDKVFIVIDGLDDVLRYRKNKMDIISSLIRSTDYINNWAVENNKKMKIILLIREDILAMLNDPDLNKIVQDSSIFITWCNCASDLKQIVVKRLLLTIPTEKEAEKYLSSLFPTKIRMKDSWQYILDYTLYKPRDVLSFFRFCQSEYPESESLSLSETQNVIKIYSNKYFIEEMKNELSGFVDEELIYVLPNVLKKLSVQEFMVNELFVLYKEQSLKHKVTVDNVKSIMQYLFDAGYIGQLIPNSSEGKRQVTFKHRNPTVRIDWFLPFISHRGLRNGLGIR